MYKQVWSSSELDGIPLSQHAMASITVLAVYNISSRKRSLPRHFS